jgi:hypothetical protein
MLTVWGGTHDGGTPSKEDAMAATSLRSSFRLRNDGGQNLLASTPSIGENKAELLYD